MKTIKKIVRNLHRYVFWALISLLISGWIFMLAGDVPKKQKVTVFTSIEAVDTDALEKALSLELPEGIRRVMVHEFGYAMFDSSEAENADIYLVTREEAEEIYGSLSPITAPDNGTGLIIDGVCYAREVFGGSSDRALAILKEGAECGPVYICFGSRSKHTATLTGSGDNAALDIAEKTIKLFEQAERYLYANH